MEKINLGGKYGLGKFTLIDDEDFVNIGKYKWYLGRDGYVRRTLKRSNNIRKTQLLHRLISNTPIGKFTDHINRNKLDNRRSNLRVCSISQNQRNRPIRKTINNKYKGITTKMGKYYQAQASVNGKTIYLGSFKDIKFAARKYDTFVKSVDREYAYLNFEDGK